MSTVEQSQLQAWVMAKAKAAQQAAKVLRAADTASKNIALQRMADALWEHRKEILAANEADVNEAVKAGESGARVERLQLSERRIEEMMVGLQQISALPDPVGQRVDAWTRPNGLKIEKVRVPLGVIAVIYESRPNVTVDSAGLALKTGNAAVLRGGKEALRSNQVLVHALRSGLNQAGLPTDAIQFIDRVERETVDILVRATGLVDLAIPRGGAGLIQRVKETALVPVIETGVGNCHVFVDGAADLDKARRIVINAKTQRPSVCNAMETLLLDRRILTHRPDWLRQLASDLVQRGVEIRVCPETMTVLTASGQETTLTPEELTHVKPAQESDWETEYLALILAVKAVDGLDEALQHIETYGTKHSEAIVTEDRSRAERFLAEVDAAAVYHNASTRFTDGFEFGFGAEIGISTQKLHARGPMGLPELTTYKYIVHGGGQTRG